MDNQVNDKSATLLWRFFVKYLHKFHGCLRRLTAIKYVANSFICIYTMFLQNHQCLTIIESPRTKIGTLTKVDWHRNHPWKSQLVMLGEGGPPRGSPPCRLCVSKHKNHSKNERENVFLNLHDAKCA